MSFHETMESIYEVLSRPVDKYRGIIRQGQFKVKAGKWIAISTVVSLAIFLSAFLTISFLELPVSQIVSIALFLGSLDLMLGYPYLKALKRIGLIEEALPEALKQMADTLKAGGTYEYALREVATAHYGPLSKEIEIVLRKLEEGENLENSLNSFSETIDSRLVKRTMAIIVDSIKAGAGLADVLDEISNDVREMHRITVERKSQTLMQVLFMTAAGVFVAPLIFGFIATIVDLFISSTTIMSPDPTEKIIALQTKDFILMLLQIYLLISVLANSIMISLMREGRISKSIIYFPILLLVAFVLYYGAAFASAVFVG